MIQVLVNIAELTAAAAKMAQALANYREAIDDVKTAAADLASKWEGDAQASFVADQDKAYRWYFSLAELVQSMIEAAKKIASSYSDNIANLKSIMSD